jgi:hypothetical protein
MAKVSTKRATKKNGTGGKKEVSELGRILRKLADAHEASGAKLMNLRELRREIASRRNG